jgi:small subunit ribosomal protein S17e
MGRIKSTAVRTLGNELIKEFGDKFSIDFEKNKKILEEVKPIKSKRTRNVLAGYISKEMQKIKERGI